MPQLIKNITGEVIQEITGTASLSVPLTGLIQNGDYIGVYGFIGYIQDLNLSTCSEKLLKPASFGLKNNSEAITLNIDY